MMYFASSAFGNPNISKSAACPLACCDFKLEPILTHNYGERYPLDTDTTLP